MMADDSNSDWDSMSEAAPPPPPMAVDAIMPAAEEPRAQRLGRGNEPPFDFSPEIKSAKAPRPSSPPPSRPPPGRPKPKKEDAYKPASAKPNNKKLQQQKTVVREDVSPAAPKSAKKKVAKKISESEESSRADGSVADTNTVITNPAAIAVAIDERKPRKGIKTRPPTVERRDTIEQVPPLPRDPPPANGTKLSFDSSTIPDFSGRGGGGSKTGVDNPAYRGDDFSPVLSNNDSFVIEERKDKSSFGFEPSAGGNRIPQPEEKIRVLQFQRPTDRYFQIEDPDDGLYSDKALANLSTCCTWCTGEIFGVARIPFVLILITLGQILTFLIQGVIRPTSDYILKPLVVCVHNQILVPLFALLANLGLLCAHAIAPLCVLVGENCCCGRRSTNGDGRVPVKEI